MSPRSDELMARARERIAGARDAIASGHPDLAVSAAYYAMLYAARAALSERDLNAKTHSGVWNLFHQTFVATNLVDAAIGGKGRETQRVREQADYEAEDFTREEAEAVLSDAQAFTAAVEQLVGT